jgi:hypothetical protein
MIGDSFTITCHAAPLVDDIHHPAIVFAASIRHGIPPNPIECFKINPRAVLARIFHEIFSTQ